jgi:hypothetical protein
VSWSWVLGSALGDVAHVGKELGRDFPKMSLGPRRGEFEWASLSLVLVQFSFSLKPPENMSAVRRGDRRAERKEHSSPYGRPNAQSKKSVRASHVLSSFITRSPLQSAEPNICVLDVVIIGFLQLFEPLAWQETVRGIGGGLLRRGHWLRGETSDRWV